MRGDGAVTISREQALEWFRLRRELHLSDICQAAEDWAIEALEAMEAKDNVIRQLYDLLNDVCSDTREKYEGDDVCGLCAYDGAYRTDSGDWANECPGFETNECFCMKNEIRAMCGVPPVETR